MKKLGRKMMGIFTAAAMTTAVFAGNVAVSADEGAVEAIQEGLMNTFSGIDQFFDLDLSEFKDADQATVEYSFSGAMPTEDGEMEFSAEAESVTDVEGGKLSLEGTVSVMGMDFPFVMYMDDSHIVAELPGILEKGISYDFSTDEAEGFLAEMMGEEGIAMINEQFRSIIPSMQMQRDESSSTKGKISEIVNDFLQTLEFEGPEEGEVDDVELEGYSTVITAEDLSALWDELKEVEITTAMNVEQYIDQVLASQSMSGNSVPISSASELEEMLASAPEIGLGFWLADDYCREVDVTVDEDTLYVIFAGEEEPWRSISLQDDEDEVASIETVEDGAEETLTVTAEGEEKLSFTYDKSTGEYVLALPEELGVGDVTGKCSVEDGDLVITANFMGFNLEMTEKIGGEAVEPEGDVLELNTAPSEKIQELMGSFMSLMGAGAAEETPAA